MFAELYRILLGDEYMDMISQLHEINREKAVKMMKSDLAFVCGYRPKKTQEEIDAELSEFFPDEDLS